MIQIICMISQNSEKSIQSKIPISILTIFVSIKKENVANNLLNFRLFIVPNDSEVVDSKKEIFGPKLDQVQLALSKCPFQLLRCVQPMAAIGDRTPAHSIPVTPRQTHTKR